MELDDCAFPLLKGAVLTDDPKVGFKDANWCLLVGAKPRGPGMERADLLKDNGRIFISQGQIIDQVAADDARVAVVGNPANTNCMIAASQAKRLTPDRFTAMVRLDQNRAQTQLAKKAGEPFYAESYDNVLSGKYPLARYLYVYVSIDPFKSGDEKISPLTREFLKFAISREGQEVVVKDGYFPIPAKVSAEELRRL